MPDQLDTIIQKMIDAGESEEDIAAVIEDFKKNPSAKPFTGDTYTGPTTFWGGVGKSLTSGEALGAGLKGGLGFLQGAVADLPSSLWEGAKTVGGLMSFNPKLQSEATSNLWEGLKGLPSHIAETTRMAGAEPQAFGRMMGQFTGQPLVTEGVAAAIPKIPAAARTVGRTVSGPVRAAGGPVEAVGDLALTAAPFAPYGFKLKTAGAGYGLRKIGQRMKTVGIPAEEANATAIRQFHGGEKPPPMPPDAPPTVMPNTPDIWDQLLKESRPQSDTDALRQFYGGDKPAPVTSPGIEINTNTDPFSRAPLDSSAPKSTVPGRVVGKAPTLEESLMEALKPQTDDISKVTLPRAPGADITPGGNPSTPTPIETQPIIQHSPSNPGTLRGSLDGGKTWKYSTDNGETWSLDEPIGGN